MSEQSSMFPSGNVAIAKRTDRTPAQVTNYTSFDDEEKNSESSHLTDTKTSDNPETEEARCKLPPKDMKDLTRNGLSCFHGMMQRGIGTARMSDATAEYCFQKMTYIPAKTQPAEDWQGYILEGPLFTLFDGLRNFLQTFSYFKAFSEKYRKQRRSLNKHSTNKRDFLRFFGCKLVKIVLEYICRALKEIDCEELQQAVIRMLRQNKAGTQEFAKMLKHVQEVEERKKFVESGKLQEVIGGKEEWEAEAEMLITENERSTIDSSSQSSLSDSFYSKFSLFTCLCLRGVDIALTTIGLSPSSLSPEKFAELVSYFQTYEELILLHVVSINRVTPRKCPSDRPWLLRSGLMRKWFYTYLILVCDNFPAIFNGESYVCCDSLTHNAHCCYTLLGELRLTRNVTHVHEDEEQFSVQKVRVHREKKTQCGDCIDEPKTMKKRQTGPKSAQEGSKSTDDCLPKRERTVRKKSHFDAD